MNYKRLGKVCICLLLVCVLFLNCSPIRVYAIDPVTFAGISVAGSIVAASIIQGVGVLPVHSEDGVFGTLVNNCVSALESASDFVVDGMIHVTGVKNAAGGYTSFVPLSLAQWIWEYIFDSFVVTSGSYNSYLSLKGNSYSTFSEALAAASHCRVVYYGSFGDDQVIYAFSSDDLPSLSSSGTLTFYNRDYCFWKSSEPVFIARSGFGSTIYNAKRLATSPAVTTSPEFTLGDIQSPYDGGEYPILLQDAPVYAPWTSAITKIPSYGNSDEEIDGIPVSIPGSFESVLGQTQTGAQAGTNDLTWADSVPDTDTLTLADIVSAIKAIPQAIGKVISEAFVKAFAISDTFIAAKVEALTLKYPYLDTFLALGTDLKAYFLSLGTKPPIIYIDLGAATGSYVWGGSQVFVDLTWYKSYKSTMDAIIGAFIWLWLAWRVFLSLPGLINGASGAAGSVIRYGERSTKSNDGGADK